MNVNDYLKLASTHADDATSAKWDITERAISATVAQAYATMALAATTRDS
jgi:hypothetical protein